MTLKKQTVLRTAQAGAIKTAFDGGKLQIRTGAQPADPDSAASGTLLVEIDLPTPAFAAAAGGATAKTGTWQGIAVATDVAGWARFISADTTKNFDVSITEGGGGGDLIIDDEDVVTGSVVTCTTFTYTVAV